MVAIDGPAGAGKSTVAARIAARFGLLNLETGAMYRAFALKAIQTDSDLDDREELDRLAARTRIRLLPAALGNRVFLDDVEVTKRIREAGRDRRRLARQRSSGDPRNGWFPCSASWAQAAAS